MLKFILAGFFILILAALHQHPVPILEGVEVYSERTIPEIIKETNTLNPENELYQHQANINKPNSESTHYQLTNDKSQLVSVTPNTY